MKSKTITIWHYLGRNKKETILAPLFKMLEACFELFIPLLVADIIARLALTAAELPIGVVTATLGAPVFIWLLLKAGR